MRRQNRHTDRTSIAAGLVLTLVLTSGLGCTTHRDRLPADIDQFNAVQNRGKEAENAGDLSAAATNYAEAVRVAERNKFLDSLRETAQVRLDRVRAASGAAKFANAPAASQPGADPYRARARAQVQPPLDEKNVLAQWEKFGQSTDPAQRLAALNDVGSLHLRQKKYAQAADDFRQSLSAGAALSDADRATLTYNLGRSLELWVASPAATSEPEARRAAVVQEYLKNYIASCRDMPNNPVAVQAAFRAARALKPPTEAAARDVTALASDLIKDGHAAEVLPELWELLVTWSDSPHARITLDAFVLALAARGVTPDEFARLYEENLHKLYLATHNDALKAPIQQLRKAFEQSLTSVDTVDAVNKRFSEWGGPHAYPFSRLLKSVGDAYAVGGKRYDRAAARYWSAFVLDPTNFDAMLHTAAVLRENHDRIDKDGAIAQAFEKLVFEQKTKAYIHKPQTPADWRKLLQMHVILAKGYMEQKRFGPADGQDPRSAVFQWERALDAEKRLRELDPRSPVSADLADGLGKAYVAAGDPSRARPQFLSALSRSLEVKDFDAAKRTMEDWKGVAGGASEHEAKVVERAAASIASYQPG